MLNPETKLAFLKHNLQRSGSSSQDQYLQYLLDVAKKELSIVGLQESEEKEFLEIDYASFLFRSRADMNGEHKMPRHLDYRIKQLLWHQKGGA